MPKHRAFYSASCAGVDVILANVVVGLDQTALLKADVESWELNVYDTTNPRDSGPVWSDNGDSDEFEDTVLPAGDGLGPRNFVYRLRGDAWDQYGGTRYFLRFAITTVDDGLVVVERYHDALADRSFS